MKIGKYTLIGGGMFPEQYDVFDGDEKIGYMRLRHGFFRADVTKPATITAYEAYPNGDGCFDDDERHKYLSEAISAIDAKRKEIENQ